MQEHPVWADPQQTVDDFVHTVAVHSGHWAFPPRDAAGRPAVVVRLADLSRVPAADRARVPLARIALPATPVPVAEATRSLADVAPAITRGGLALIVDNGLLGGVISAQHIAHASELAALSAPPAPRSPH